MERAGNPFVGSACQPYTDGMRKPFPGMDPWLEHPALWPDVHNALLAELRLRLGRALRPSYYVALEERVYLADESGLIIGVPDATVVSRSDPPPRAGSGVKAGRSSPAVAVRVPTPVEVREYYLEVRRPVSHEVITVVELLSPANKLEAGGGRRRYEEKRLGILGTRTHLVEVDLVRVGRPMLIYDSDPAAFTYRVLVSRGDSRPQAELYGFSVRDPIPVFALPLDPGASEPEVDLGAVLADIYEAAGWDLRIDYGVPPVPPLSVEDATWAARTLRDPGEARGSEAMV